jgi:hypothetical protein
MGNSKNTLNTTLKKIIRLDKMIVLSMLTIVMTLVYVSLVISCREKGRSIFLEGVCGHTHMFTVEIQNP